MFGIYIVMSIIIIMVYVVAISLDIIPLSHYNPHNRNWFNLPLCVNGSLAGKMVVVL